MISRFMIALGLALATAVSAVAAVPTVRFNSPITVKSNRMLTLGEMADLTGMSKSEAARLSKIEIARAPLPGATRTVGAGYIKMRIASASVDTAKLKIVSPETLSLTGRSQIVKGEDIAAAARDYLVSQMPKDSRRYEAEISRVPHDITVADGTLELKAQAPSYRVAAGPRTVVVAVTVDGKQCATASVFVEVRAFAEVLVAKASIAQNTPIDESSTSWETRDVSRLAYPVIRETEMAQGVVASRGIASGAVITTDMLKAPAAIEAGSAVTIVVRSESVRLSARGTAEQAGRPGDTIRVTGPFGSGKLRAVVVEPGLVEIRI